MTFFTKPTTHPKFVSALLILLVAATACSDGRDSAPLAFTDGPTVLTMWSWGGTGHELMIDQFEAANPNIIVEFEESSFDQHHRGLLNAVEARGDVPDVAAVEAAYLPQLWEHEERFTDLRDFGADALEGDYLDWRWDQGRTPTGSIIGLPTDVGGLSLAYRRDLFAAAGLPSTPEQLEQQLQTWDDLIELGAQFTAANETTAFLDSPASLFEARFGQETAGYVDADGTAMTGPGSAVHNAWELSMRAIQRGITGDYHQFSPEWNEAMGDGGFAALTAPSWMRAYLSSNAPETAGLWGLVTLPGVHGNWGGSALTVPKDAENPEAAWKLVKFLTSEPAQFEIFRQSGNFPSTPAAYDRPEISGLADPFFDNQVVGPMFVESVIGAPVKSRAPQDRGINRLLTDQLHAYNSLQASRRVGIASAWAQVQTDIDEYVAAAEAKDNSSEGE